MVGGLPVGLLVFGEGLCEVFRALDPVEVGVEPGAPDLKHRGPERLGGHTGTRRFMYSSQCASKNLRIPRLGR